MLADYHVHCMFSDDSWYPPERVCEDAWKNNLDEICFTDHVDYGIKPDWNDALSAKVMDGQRVLNVDLPSIMPTVCIMLIMRFGSIMGVGFEKVYLMQTNLNNPVSEVISTYVYKVGMGKPADYSYGAAVGLFNSVVNCTFVVFVNWITKKLSSDDVSLF